MPNDSEETRWAVQNIKNEQVGEKLDTITKILTKLSDAVLVGNGTPSLVMKIDRNASRIAAIVAVGVAISGMVLFLVGRLIYDAMTK